MIPLLHDHLARSAARLPNKSALVAQERRMTYGEIAGRAHGLARLLAQRGVSRGDRVVVLADATPESAIAFWAVLEANAIVSMVHPQTRSEKLAYILRDSGAKVLIADKPHAGIDTVVPGPDGWPIADDPPPRRCIDVDLASIVYTSGSTGEPKGVMLTHRNMLTACASITSYIGNVEDDVILCVLPLSFDYGLYQMIMAFSVGARVVLERSFAYPATILSRVVSETITGFPGVPTLFAMLAELKSTRDYDLSSVRYVTNTAAALPPKHIGAIQQIFPRARVFSMYGLTECKRCTYLPPEDLARKPTSVGIAIPNTEVWVVDDDDRRVPPGVVGQLVVRGATVMAGYWNKPEETAKKLRAGPIPGERVLYTGDLCKMDEEGYVTFVGRMDDIIKSRGEKVAPKEIENALLAVDGVVEAAVVGVPDPILGEAPVAFVVLASGATLDERALRRACQERLEPFMVPKTIRIAPSLPRSGNGKIDKRALALGGSTS